ncbi:MAG TPA: hypothetical protein VK395_17420 [Gemmataceae bacterium]|nr:hypothetical protein [Gemmataceae bacterium]
MNEPKKTVTPPAKEVHPAIRESLQPERSQYQLLVRFYRRMHRQRVYPLLVTLQRFNPGRGIREAANPVRVRALVPGSEVTPAELTLDPAKPGAQASFHVTPLAKGDLGEACVQLFSGEQLVQEVRLPMKSVSQRLTWVLAVLTVLLPACLLYAKYNPIRVPPPPAPIKLPAELEKNETVKLKTSEVNKAAPAGGGNNKAAGGGNRAVMNFDSIRSDTPRRPTTPGEVLAEHINENVPLTGGVDVFGYAARGIGKGYDYLRALSSDVPIAFYVGALLLGATIVSWLIHVRHPARRRGAPVALPS